MHAVATSLHVRARAAAALVAAAGAGTSSCDRELLPPQAQVVVVVDTDLPAELATRLRVDLFTADGVWFDSREFTRASTRDWPASFGVVAPPSLADVIARMRVYPEGHVRDYRGERFTELGSAPGEPAPGAGPRLFPGEADTTPVEEPRPEVAVDRFVRLAFARETKRILQVTLRATCAGTMASVAVSGRDVAPRSVASCVATKDERLPLAAPDEPLQTASLVGSWAGAPPCEPPADRERRCIPGGAYVFGDVDLDPQTTEFPPRERIARIDRFWLDRTEVTVGAYRAALAAGFVPPAPVRVNDGPLTADPVDGCSFTSEPSDREALALTCVPWQTARAYCRWLGGDLPTEMRWEYATARAGKPAKTTFAWGDEEPTCDRASFGRAYVPPAPGFCQDGGSGPLVVGRPAGDVIPPGVTGLAGGVSEWMLDAAAPLDADCWREAPLEEGACLRDDTRRSIRGGAWAGPPPLLVSALRRSAAEDTRVASLGFRCAYDAP